MNKFWIFGFAFLFVLFQVITQSSTLQAQTVPSGLNPRITLMEGGVGAGTVPPALSNAPLLPWIELHQQGQLTFPGVTYPPTFDYRIYPNSGNASGNQWLGIDLQPGMKYQMTQEVSSDCNSLHMVLFARGIKPHGKGAVAFNGKVVIDGVQDPVAHTSTLSVVMDDITRKQHPINLLNFSMGNVPNWTQTIAGRWIVTRSLFRMSCTH